MPAFSGAEAVVYLRVTDMTHRAKLTAGAAGAILLGAAVLGVMLLGERNDQEAKLGDLQREGRQTDAKGAPSPAISEGDPGGDRAAPPERIAVAPAGEIDFFAPGPADFWSLDVEVVSAADGAPLGGALVIVGDWDIAGRPSVEKRTDSAGKAGFEQMSIWIDPEVEARCEGFITKGDSLDYDSGKTRIELDPGVCVSGRVLLAPNRLPAANVDLTVNQSRIRYGNVVFRTDRDGYFVSEPIYPDAPFEMHIDHAGYAVWRREFERADLWEPIEIVLGATGCRVEGFVRDAAGAPAAGAQVWFGFQRESEKTWPGEAATGPGGEYVFYGFPAPGDCTVSARAADGSRGSAGPVAVGASAESIRIDVTAHVAAAQLAVHVQDAAGKPVAGATVALLDEGGMCRRSDIFNGRSWGDAWAQSDETGTCLFRAVPPGTHIIWAVRHDEYERAEKFLVRVAAGDRRDVTVQLPEGKAIIGLVIDAAGRPAESREILFRADEPPPGSPEGTPPLAGFSRRDPRDLAFCFTDRAGRFRLCELPDQAGTLLVEGETNYRLDGAAAGGEEQGRVRPGGPPLRIILGDKTVIRGRMAGCAAGDRVRVMGLHPVPGGGYWGFGGACSEEGTFEIALEFRWGFPEGKYEFVLEAPCTAPLPLSLPCLRIGEVQDLGIIQTDPGMVFSGTVRDSSGKPMSARIECSCSELNWRKTLNADSGGCFRADRLPRRQVRIVVDAGQGGYAQHTRTVSPTGPDWLDVVLLRYGRVEGRIADQQGRPLGTAVIGLRRSGDENTTRRGSTDTAGRFSFDWIPPDRYRILVQPAGGEEWIETCDVEVREDESASVEVVLPL